MGFFSLPKVGPLVLELNLWCVEELVPLKKLDQFRYVNWAAVSEMHGGCCLALSGNQVIENKVLCDVDDFV